MRIDGKIYAYKNLKRVKDIYSTPQISSPTTKLEASKIHGVVEK